MLDATISHLYLNQILPLALSRQGKLVFHASAVEIGEVGVAFLGASGKGKSTLATSFATNGYRFLTDDALIIATSEDDEWIVPSHPSIRVWDDSYSALIPNGTKKNPSAQYTSKIRVLAGDELPFCTKRRRLRRLYFLGDRKVKETIIEPLSPTAAIIELVKHSFLLDIEEGAMLAAHFSELTDLLSAGLVFDWNTRGASGRSPVCAIRSSLMRAALMRWRGPAGVLKHAVGASRQGSTLALAPSRHQRPSGTIMKSSDRITVSPNAVARQVGDETVILHLGSGTYFGLDAVGARIWQLIGEGKNLQEIRDVVLDEYDVSRENLERDMDMLIKDLLEKDLVSAP